ncbi:MAG: leucine-rich repeat protein [Clostridia bacterium]|nr:leucine-rich repeat protein [Clostridia bacterium]
MKKKIFLTLAIVMVLTCLFAISISATEWFGDVEIIDNNGDGVSDISITNRVHTIVEKGNEEGVPASEDARVKIKCTCEAGSHTFPAYYLTSPKSTGTRFYCFDYAELNKLLPSYCTSASAIDGTKILAYEIPNGYTAIYSGFFYDGDTYAAKSIQYFSFATCTTMTSLETTATGKNWFADSTVQEVDLGTKITNIPVMFLYNCDSLIEFTLPDSVTTIAGQAFQLSGSLEKINISINSNLSSMGALAFGNCTSLEAFLK